MFKRVRGSIAAAIALFAMLLGPGSVASAQNGLPPLMAMTPEVSNRLKEITVDVKTVTLPTKSAP